MSLQLLALVGDIHHNLSSNVVYQGAFRQVGSK